MEKFIKENIVISDIELACYVEKGAGATVHKNRKNHGIVLALGDEGTYIFDGGKKVLFPKNHLLYLPKYSNYHIEGPKGGCFAINFQIAGDKVFEPFSFKIKNKTDFYERFRRAEVAWRTKPVGFEMKCMAELYQIFYNMKKEYADYYTSSGLAEIIRPAIEYIHIEYINEIISVSYLSAICGVSESYFRRVFQRVYGMPPVKYINSLKILRARELILSNMYTISQVAELSGFNDEAYFSREFKKTVGVSPSEYK